MGWMLGHAGGNEPGAVLIYRRVSDEFLTELWNVNLAAYAASRRHTCISGCFSFSPTTTMTDSCSSREVSLHLIGLPASI